MATTRKLTKRLSYGLGALILALCSLVGIKRPAWAEEAQKDVTMRETIIALKTKLEILEHKANLTNEEIDKINELDNTIDTYLIQSEGKEFTANATQTENTNATLQLKPSFFVQPKQAMARTFQPMQAMARTYQPMQAMALTDQPKQAMARN